MSRFIKIIVLLIISLDFISCNEKNARYEENYPKTVSQLDGFISINYHRKTDIDSFNKFPKRIKKLASNYLINKIGKKRFDSSTYTWGYIAYNEETDSLNKKNNQYYVLNSQEKEKWWSKYKYPFYNIGFEFSDLSNGIAKYDVNLKIDDSGEIIQDISFPKIDIEPDNLNFISIDSIHKMLSERKISSQNLELDLGFNKGKQILFYYARTLIRGGSIAGPSCMPLYQEHFKVNVVTGEIVEYDFNNVGDYYSN